MNAQTSRPFRQVAAPRDKVVATHEATVAAHRKLDGNASRQADAPWSHRFGPVTRLLICVLSGAGVGVVGTMAHRMGASMNIPYGLVLGLLIVGLSTWCARSRSGVVGLATHLIASSTAAWGMAIFNPGDSALTPIGFGGNVPFFSEHAGYIWLFGMIVVQIALLCCPSPWFSIADGVRPGHPARARRD